MNRNTILIFFGICFLFLPTALFGQQETEALIEVEVVGLDSGLGIGRPYYIVKQNDSLWKIAINLYGDPELWRLLYKGNYDLLAPTPHLIYKGQQLVVPSLEE